MKQHEKGELIIVLVLVAGLVLGSYEFFNSTEYMKWSLDVESYEPPSDESRVIMTGDKK